jgi:DNA-binding MarR family transcriptional regulator
LAEEVAVQKLLALSEPDDSEQETKYPGLSKAEESVLELLSDTPIRFADICERVKLECANASAAIMGLELRQFATRLTGDKYVRTDPPTGRSSALLKLQKQKRKHSKITTKIIDFIKERFQGVSRKYLQFYAALYWIHADRKRWGPDTIRQLCVQSRHIPYREILEFVTPPTVKVHAHARI